MDCVFNQQKEREEITPQKSPQLQLKLICLPLAKHRKFTNANPQVTLGFWVSNSLRKLYYKIRFTGGSCLKRLRFDGMMVNNSMFYGSNVVIEEDGRMEKLNEKTECNEGGGVVATFAELIEEARRRSSSSSSCDNFSTETEEQRERQSISMVSFSPPPISWSMENADVPDCSTSVNGGEDDEEKPILDEEKMEKQATTISEMEMMKERFSKLLLGEDMSGSGNGVSTALAISNAITNLCATVFGQLWRLEPLPPEKKAMWKREMEWLLCVSDHIVEFSPTWQTFPDGTKLEVMTCRPRADLYINLPALRKLDNMLLDILDSFENTEFWYVDQGILALEGDGSASFRKALQRQEEKWWLPVPRVPPGGLHENSRKHLQHRRDSTNQILKAAMAINNVALADMEVPESYLETLPKNGKACLGDVMYRYIISDQFSPEGVLDNLDLSSEHQAIELANRVEASIYMWRRRTNSRPANNSNRSNSRSSWELVKDLMIDADKRDCLADRAESLLLCLKQWFPGLPQTTLDMSKIQFNKDVGKSILESYSRVLESLAFNIVARIDDLLYVDDLAKHSDHFSSISKVSLIPHKSVTIPYAVPVSGTPYKSAITTQRLTPARLFSPLKGERSPFVASGKLPHMGIGVKKVTAEESGKSTNELDSSSNANLEASPSPSGLGSYDKTKYYVSPGK